MPVITVAQAGGLNRYAMLDMIRFSEGTSTSPVTQNDGYDVIVSGLDGPEVFTDYRDHPFAPVPPSTTSRPSKRVNSAGLTSNASGGYQIMLKNWPYYRAFLRLPDFSPLSQDRYALQQFRERGALPLIDAGDLEGAIAACRNIWASLPGAGYGQHENQYDSLRAAFALNGGELLA